MFVSIKSETLIPRRQLFLSSQDLHGIPDIHLLVWIDQNLRLSTREESAEKYSGKPVDFSYQNDPRSY